jgi:NAD(P)-dependent dehydrogenase (short-subunit alcohol dehydrogenase family)
MSSERLAGKTVLVTGGGSGLGRAMGIRLLESGAKVVFCDLNVSALQETETLIKKTQSALFVTCNITEASARERMLGAAKARFGDIHVLINNAGIASGIIREDFLERRIPFWEIDEKVMRRFFDVNSIAPQMLAVAMVKGMVERGWGRIVNVTTSLDTMLKLGFAGYGGSKAALEAHTAIMALDLADSGVTANVLVPGGPTDTPMVPKTLDRSKMLRPERMAPPAIWLSSNDSNGVTGRRFVAALWDPSLPDVEASNHASAPVAWTGYGVQAINPPGAR